MMKMIAVVFACLVAASSAQFLAGSTTWQHESTAQQHAPWAASASTRSQVHGPDATILAETPVLAAAPITYAAAPIIHEAPVFHHAAALPLAYLRR